MAGSSNIRWWFNRRYVNNFPKFELLDELVDLFFSSDDFRRQIWPKLLEVSWDPEEIAPSLEQLSEHSEYNQVILDVNRSLKRFPPGIPYEQRVALQDQLTVLILRVIMKYPDLRYYQVRRLKPNLVCVTKF